MIYTAFIDLDDTLLNGEKRISAHLQDALKRFQARGNSVVFATARSRRLHGLQECVKTIAPHFIFHNGAEIVSAGETVYRGFFGIEETARIGGYLTDKGIRADVILDDAYYANYDAPAVWGSISNFGFTSFKDADFRAPKFSVLLDDENQASALDALNDRASITMMDDNSGAIVSPKGVTKGTAVRFMLDRLFNGSKSIFIGNDHNDIAGFEACDIKVAVKNAEPAVLERADIVIGSCDEDGVACFLDEMCENAACEFGRK